MNPIEHGTYAGYQQCMKLHGRACNRCLEAQAAYMKEWRKKNGEAAKRLKRLSNIRQKAKTILAQRHKEEFQELVEWVKIHEDLKSGHPESGQSETSET